MPDIIYKMDTSLFQSTTASCWYASYCMLYKWKGLPTTAVREKIEKAGLDYSDYWRNGLPTEKYGAVRNALGLCSFRRSYFYSLAEDPEYMAKTLTDYGPFWCALSSPSEHAVVVSGVLVIGAVIITNPWSDGEGAAQVKALPMSEFRRRLGSSDQSAAAQMFY